MSQSNRALAPKHEKLKLAYKTNKSLFRALDIGYKKHVQVTRPLLSLERQEQRNRLRQHI